MSYKRSDAVIVVDVFNDFDHEDGDRLLSSFRERAPNMRRAIDAARKAGVSVVYVNDERGGWQGDAPGLIRGALRGRGGELIKPLVTARSISLAFSQPSKRSMRSSNAILFQADTIIS